MHRESPPEALLLLIFQSLGRPCTICHSEQSEESYETSCFEVLLF
jgi:hypothetical protein